MFSILLASMAGATLDQDPVRNDWIAEDPRVRFVEGTASPEIGTLGSWVGEVTIFVRCIVQADGSLRECVVVDETVPRRLNHVSARVNVGRMRLALYNAGPMPGDSLTVSVAVTRRW